MLFGKTEEVEIIAGIGVPQGSVLEPIFNSILFLIYINGMAEYTTHSLVRLFADDAIIQLAQPT